MKENIIIGVGVVVFLLIIIAVFYFIIKSSKNKTNIEIENTNNVKKQTNALDDLIKAAKNANSTTSLNKVVLAFIQSQSFEDRVGIEISEDTKKKLGFISAVCANKCAEAKIIAFLNHELAKRYPSYRREIDLYENLGLAKRRMK